MSSRRLARFSVLIEPLSPPRSTGKWHLGHYREAFCPWARGFHYFFGNLLSGGDQAGGHLQRSEPYAVRANGASGARAAARQFEGRYLVEASANATLAAGDARLSEAAACDAAASGTTFSAVEAGRYDNLYTTELYARRAVDALRAYSPRDENADSADAAAPYFVYLALQAVHSPLQVDDRWVESGGCEAATANRDRQKLCGMVHEADHHVGSLVGELRARGDWPSTVFVFLSDNGASASFGGSNRPLRGEKGQYWEGGVRAPALLAGGHTEHALQAAGGRAYVSRALMHVTDVTATLLAVAGVAPAALAAKGLDGVDQWDALVVGGVPAGKYRSAADAAVADAGARRSELLINANSALFGGGGALRLGRFKYVEVPEPNEDAIYWHTLAWLQTHRAADFAAAHGWLKALREQIWAEGGNDVGAYLFDLDANPYEEARDADVACDGGAAFEACHSLLGLPADAPVSRAQAEAWASAEDDARARLRAYAAGAARSSTQFEYDGALVDPALFNGSLGVPWRDADNVPFAMVTGLRPAGESLATSAELAEESSRRGAALSAADATADERPRPALLLVGTVAINVLATSAVVFATGRSRWRRAPRSDAYDPIA